MKELTKEFVMNADKSGDNRFVQVKRENNVALYRREGMDGSLKGFEIFFVKTVKAGASLPGVGKVEEDYEPYPGGKTFGKTAWFIGGINAVERAHKQFDELVKGESVVEVASEEEEANSEVVPVVKVSSATIKEGLKLPEKPFTQKELAAANGIENYKQVYSDLQKLLSAGRIKVSGHRDSTRGKSAKLFEEVKTA